MMRRVINVAKKDYLKAHRGASRTLLVATATMTDINVGNMVDGKSVNH